MKLTTVLLAIACPLLAFARMEIPQIKDKQELCFVSKFAEGAEIKGISISLRRDKKSIKSEIIAQDSEGIQFNQLGVFGAKLPASEGVIQINEDGGSLAIMQNSSDPSGILVRVLKDIPLKKNGILTTSKALYKDEIISLHRRFHPTQKDCKSTLIEQIKSSEIEE